MKIFVAAMIAALTISVVAHAQAPQFSADQRAEGEAQVKVTGTKLADYLRDPGSARFRNVHLQMTVGTDRAEHVEVCGEVNSKAGSGGMSGWIAFQMAGSDGLIFGETMILGGTQNPFSIGARTVCSNGNPTIDSRDYTPELKAAILANAGQ